MSSTSSFRSPSPAPTLPRAVWAIAGAVLLVLLVLAGAYGFFPDEMYFILAGRHLDFGYVDQPPLTPLLSAAPAQLFGASPVSVRLLPAFAAGISVPICADMARHLGGSARAQVFAASLLAISGWTPAAHLDSTTTFDLLFWTLATWLLVPLLISPDPGRDWKRWLALGLVMGIALENKSVPVFLAASLAGGVLLARRWEIVRSRGLWVAIAIALVICVPNVIWQAANGWPQFAMAQAIASGQQGGTDRIGELIDLLLLCGPFVFPVAIAGLIWLLRGSASRAWRPLGIAALIAVALMLVTAGKYYYAAGFIPLVLAAGAIKLDGWLSRGHVRLKWSVFMPAAAGGATILALIGLPILPPAQLRGADPSLAAESLAQIGWPEFATQVEGVAASLPPNQREHSVIFTQDYSVYGGLSFYGQGLPPLYSAHNSVWYWGRPPDGAAPVILVGDWGGPPPDVFTGCSVKAVVDNGLDLATPEQGTPIWVCSGTTQPWSQIWPILKHIDAS
ncbi:MAG: glycosyltransferase family 39 protein [Candidatus Limnocylindrales bacterium]